MSAPRYLIYTLWMAAAVGSASCSSDEPTTTIHVCGNLEVPADVDALRVVIADSNHVPIRQGVRQLWSCPGPRLRALPESLRFGAVSGDVFVRVQGLKDGVPVLATELRTDLSAGASEATVSLSNACIGARCAAGKTCVDGACELVALAAQAVSSCRRPPTAGADVGRQPTDAHTSADAASAVDAGRPGAELCPDIDAASADVDGSDAADAASQSTSSGDTQ